MSMNFIDAAGVLADSAELLINDKMAHEAKAVVSDVVADYDALAPDWTQAPDWAQWYSIDTDGNCLWHRSQPITQSYPGGWITRDNNAHAKHVRLPLGIDWRLCIWQRSDVTP